MIRIAIVAPTAAERAWLQERVQSDTFVVIGERRTMREALALDPDVVLVADDVEVTGGRADEEGERPAVLAVSDEPHLAATLAASGAGAWGLVPADATAAEIQAAVGAVAHGLTVLPPRMARSRWSRIWPAEPADARSNEHLTARELDVLDLAARGLSNRGIADALGISEHTVKFHLASIYGKLGVSTRTEAVSKGLRTGIIAI